MRVTYDTPHATSRFRGTEIVQMRLLLKLPVGMLFCFAAAACSADAGSEQDMAPPTAEPAATLPTAVPPEGDRAR